jgi:hypothetical protein
MPHPWRAALRRASRFVARAAACAAISVIALSASAQPAGPKPGEADPAEAEYTQHMNNGVTLFQLKHYGPAIVEFEAAYKAKPKAAPLVNEALCYREQMKYPEAVAALEKALSQHADTLDAANEKAAEQAILEMRPLIAYVELDVQPSDARVTLDGDDLPRTSWPSVQVSPNEHTIEASRDGYATESAKLTIASGEHKHVTISLKHETGTLHVLARKKDGTIEIDGKVVGAGEWSGPLDAGEHSVRLAGEPDPITIKIAAGSSTTLDRSHPPDAAKPAPKPKTPPLAPKRDMGFYLFVEGGLLYPTRLPEAFQEHAVSLNLAEAANNFGALGGVRLGYRVNTFAGFEGMFQYSNVTGGRHEDPSAKSDPAEYSFSSWRFGPMLRLMSPGKIVRFVGTLGGGFAVHSIRFRHTETDAGCLVDVSSASSPNQCASGWGVDFFASTDAGVEFSLDGVLLGASLALVVDGTKGTVDFGDHGGLPNVAPPYANDSLPFIGPEAHFGYAFW